MFPPPLLCCRSLVPHTGHPWCTSRAALAAPPEENLVLTFNPLVPWNRFGSYPAEREDGTPALDPKALFVERMGACTLVTQMEEGKSNGFRHWQFYVAFKARKRFSQIRNGMLAVEIKKPIWLRGIPANSKDIPRMMNYCRKTDSRIGEQIEVGTTRAPSNKGSRNDLTDFRTMLETKQGNLDIMDKDVPESALKIVARYPRFAMHIQSRILTKKQRKPFSAVCFWGPTGTGKSARAKLLAAAAGFTPEQIYVKNPNNCWWDNYDPCIHRVVLVDEVRDLKAEVVAMFLEQMSPGNVSSVQVKGATTLPDVELWLFTSPSTPSTGCGTSQAQETAVINFSAASLPRAEAMAIYALRARIPTCTLARWRPSPPASRRCVQRVRWTLPLPPQPRLPLLDALTERIHATF